MRRYLEQHPSLHMIEVARQSIAPESGITVVLSTTDVLQTGIKDELIQVIGRRGAMPMPLCGFSFYWKHR